MKAIRVAAPAERDLDHIWYYIARKSGGAEIANGLIDPITETFALFSREPEAGTKRDEIELGLQSFREESAECLIWETRLSLTPSSDATSQFCQSTYRPGYTAFRHHKRTFNAKQVDGNRGFSAGEHFGSGDGGGLPQAFR